MRWYYPYGFFLSQKTTHRIAWLKECGDVYSLGKAGLFRMEGGRICKIMGVYLVDARMCQGHYTCL